MGWILAANSLATILQNPGAAVRVSLAPFVIAAVLSVIIWQLLGVGIDTVAFAIAVGSVGGRVAAALASTTVIVIFAASWSALAWHRFLLQDEVPGFLPAFDWNRTGSYALRSTMITLSLLILLFPVSAVGIQVLTIAHLFETNLVRLGFSFVMTSLMAFLWFRIALVLPAVAVEREFKVSESWAVTNIRSQDILTAGAVLVALDLVAGALLDLVPLGQSPVLVLRLLLTWFFALAGTGLLTMLYAELVERRRL